MGIENHINKTSIIFNYQNIFGSKNMVRCWNRIGHICSNIH